MIFRLDNYYNEYDFFLQEKQGNLDFPTLQTKIIKFIEVSKANKEMFLLTGNVNRDVQL